MNRYAHLEAGTVQSLIDALTDYIQHGGCPSAAVMAWDPDGEDWFPVSGFIARDTRIELHTDEG